MCWNNIQRKLQNLRSLISLTVIELDMRSPFPYHYQKKKQGCLQTEKQGAN